VRACDFDAPAKAEAFTRQGGGKKMRRSFEKHIDLEWLARQIIQFFEARKFDEITAVQNAIGYQIIAGDSRKYKLRSNLNVDIRKEVEGFSVSFQLAKEVKRFNYPVMLATFFGGGYFFLKDLKSDESWRKIEREFWQEVGMIVMAAEESISPSRTRDNLDGQV
jgi:hypothetical protein